jgi:hypothetical protein
MTNVHVFCKNIVHHLSLILKIWLLATYHSGTFGPQHCRRYRSRAGFIGYNRALCSEEHCAQFIVLLTLSWNSCCIIEFVLHKMNSDKSIHFNREDTHTLYIHCFSLSQIYI